MDSSSRVLRVAAGLLAAFGLLLTVPTHAGPSPHMNQAFGLIGLVPGESLRLNVADTRFQAPDGPDQPALVDVHVSFHDAGGNLMNSNTVNRLAPGDSFSYTHEYDRTDVPPTDDGAGSARSARQMVRALVTAQLPPGPCNNTNALDFRSRNRACQQALQQLANLRSSLEVLNADGSVRLFLDRNEVYIIDDNKRGLVRAIIDDNKRSIIDDNKKSALFTVAAGQSAEIHVTNVVPVMQTDPPGPVHVSLHFFDSRGNLVLAGEEVALGPNESTKLVWDAPTGLAATQLRAVMQAPDVGYRSGPSPHMRSMVNVVDLASGRTELEPCVTPNPVQQ